MALTGSAAPVRTSHADVWMPYAPEDTSSFVSVDGGGLDARVREGVSSTLTRTVSLALAAVVALFALGSTAVALTSNTVALLQSNATLSSQIETVRAENEDLRIECALLSRADRVARIATQNLGMVYAQDAHHFQLH